MAKIHQPVYRIVRRDGAFELRAYEPMVLAEVQLPGMRRAAMDEGFRILHGYIRGENANRARLDMTIPVTVQPAGEKNGKGWIIRFIMPPGMQPSALPKPTDRRIALFAVPVGRAAAVRFSGLAGDPVLKARTQELRGWMKAMNLAPAGPPTYAFYNSPFSLPFLRRNEVLVGVEY